MWPGTQPSPDEMRAHAAVHLAAYKVPRHILMRTQPLPRNPAGKVLKAPLREAFAQACRADGTGVYR
jgi:acyl-CoA synthetase (AMP-forming)/AMP-acid ligase II